MSNFRLVWEEPDVPYGSMGCSNDAVRFLRSVWESDINLLERFYMLMLNRKNEIIGYRNVSLGSYSGTVVDAKYIFSCALKHAPCSALIVAHNHPSGNLAPSTADKQLTTKLTLFGDMIDMKVLDHLILTANGSLSFADEGLL